MTIAAENFSSLAESLRLVIKAAVERDDAAPEQVSLVFLMARGHIAIPKSASLQRQNLDAVCLQLNARDMDEIDALDRGHRFVDPEGGHVWD